MTSEKAESDARVIQGRRAVSVRRNPAGMKRTAFRTHVRSGSRTCAQLVLSNSQLSTKSPRPQLVSFSIRPPTVTAMIAPIEAIVRVVSSQGRPYLRDNTNPSVGATTRNGKNARSVYPSMVCVTIEEGSCWRPKHASRPGSAECPLCALRASAITGREKTPQGVSWANRGAVTDPLDERVNPCQRSQIGRAELRYGAPVQVAASVHDDTRRWSDAV